MWELHVLGEIGLMIYQLELTGSLLLISVRSAADLIDLLLERPDPKSSLRSWNIMTVLVNQTFLQHMHFLPLQHGWFSTG